MQFKLEDTMSFRQDVKGHLRQLPRKHWKKRFCLKNGWKGVCVYQEHNGDEKFIPVRALGRRFILIQNKVKKKDILVSVLGGRQTKRSQ